MSMHITDSKLLPWYEFLVQRHNATFWVASTRRVNASWSDRLKFILRIRLKLMRLICVQADNGYEMNGVALIDVGKNSRQVKVVAMIANQSGRNQVMTYCQTLASEMDGIVIDAAQQSASNEQYTRLLTDSHSHSD